MTTIAQPSVMSLLLEMRFDGQRLATGTGFVVISPKGKAVLITNRHNVTGRDQNTGEVLSRTTGGLPNEVAITHNRQGRLGAWEEKVEPLYGDGETPLWIEHPVLGEKADCVGLPLTQTEGVELFPYDATGGPLIAAGPASVVSVVGFPFGLSRGGGLAIWATGFIASEISLGEPTFLIDCRSRKGQSGSAVIAYRGGGAVEMENGVTSFFEGPVWRLLGIYSGRINAESDLGTVWKVSVIRDILQSADGDWPRSFSGALQAFSLGEVSATWGPLKA